MPRWPDPTPDLKRQLADEILFLLDGWTQAYAADFIGATQSRISELRNAQLDKFSVDRLLQYLTRLGRRIEIVTTTQPGAMVHPHRELDHSRLSSPPAPAGDDSSSDDGGI